MTAKTYRDRAIVLRGYRLGEADRIEVLLTENSGQVRAVAKGVRRTTSKFGARLQPFSVIDAQLHRGRNLDTISQVETVANYSGVLGADYGRFTAATLMAETAERLTVEGEMTGQHYRLLYGALAALASGQHPDVLTLTSYLLRAVATAGWAPVLNRCVVCGKTAQEDANLRRFSISAGGAVCAGCGVGGAIASLATVTLTPETLGLSGELLAGNWEAATDYSPEIAQRALALASDYTQWHIERRLKSLPMLEIQEIG